MNEVSVNVPSDQAGAAMCLNQLILDLTYGAPIKLAKTEMFLQVPPSDGVGTCLFPNHYRNEQWSNLQFQDPLPAGSILIGVEAKIFGRTCLGSAGNIRFGLGLVTMDTPVTQTVALRPTARAEGVDKFSSMCISSNTCQEQGRISKTYQTGWPGYAYGQLNSLNVQLLPTGEYDDHICISYGNIVLTYFTNQATSTINPALGKSASVNSLDEDAPASFSSHQSHFDHDNEEQTTTISVMIDLDN